MADYNNLKKNRKNKNPTTKQTKTTKQKKKLNHKSNHSDFSELIKGSCCRAFYCLTMALRSQKAPRKDNIFNIFDNSNMQRFANTSASFKPYKLKLPRELHTLP